MKIIIIQPPLVQLNTPYPCGAYLSSFLKNQGHTVKWYDLSNQLYRRFFSRDGLHKIFQLSSKNALKLANKAESHGDENTAYNLRRYLSQSEQWCSWIDKINDILKSSNNTHEIAHEFVFGAFTPRGARMENYLAELNHDLTTDDAFPLASLAIADLADYITAAFDSEFSLIRYAESLTVSETSFSQIESGIDRPVIKEFYEPLLNDLFSDNDFVKNEERFLVGIAVPFAGTFSAALATGRYFKKQFENKAFVCFGGGFINTELRNVKEPSLVKYTDCFIYDRGYGSFHALFNNQFIYTRNLKDLPEDGLYKLQFFINSGNQDKRTLVIEMKATDTECEQFEKLQTASTFPDYSDINFNDYPKMTDDTNPMHRLWNDGSWLKAYLAHGCYWHKCAFCDTTLDYVKSYCLTNVSLLYKSLLTQAEDKKIFGIHFVDEAAPPKALIEFAVNNRSFGNKLNFWGNIRFEKTYTRDITDFLAVNGLIGVSGGIEIATGQGLTNVNKGTDIESIVASCCAFKESGILVHAYMIYGYWAQSEQDIIDSMETLRQLFEAGLLDSSFWHKYVLTKNSTDYMQYLTNGNKLTNGSYSLKPIYPSNKQPLFSQNNLHFEGERNSEKFETSLNLALESWMHGEKLNLSVNKFFNFKTPAPKIPKDFIENYIQKYESKRNKAYKIPLTTEQAEQTKKLLLENSLLLSAEDLNFHAKQSNLNQSQDKQNDSLKNKKPVWLGGKLYPLPQNKIGWQFMGEEFTADKNVSLNYFRGKGLCLI